MGIRQGSVERVGRINLIRILFKKNHWECAALIIATRTKTGISGIMVKIHEHLNGRVRFLHPGTPFLRYPVGRIVHEPVPGIQARFIRNRPRGSLFRLTLFVRILFLLLQKKM
jgi:hypothetical protein